MAAVFASDFQTRVDFGTIAGDLAWRSMTWPLLLIRTPPWPMP